MTSTAGHGNGSSIQNEVIDWSVLDQFLVFRKPGGPDPRRRIITIYLDSSPMLMEAIKTAINGADGSLLSNSSHSLKSSSMNVGAGSLGSLCAELERTGKTGSIVEAKNLVERLKKQYTDASAALHDALQEMCK